MVIDIKKLRPIKANELFPGAIFYLLRDDGEFDKCDCQPDSYSPRQLKEYREATKKYSVEGKLFTRRDKAFHDFRE
jgi:hypothetical protein